MKKLLLLLGVLVATLFGGNVPLNATAKAEAEDYVADSYKIEISESEVMLPVPTVPDGWAYAITLKDGETVLGEKVSKYLFENTGEYTLVYTIHKNGSLTDVVEETATLIVADMTKPTVTTDGYDLEYYVGDTLTVQKAQVYDNVDVDLEASVTLRLGEEELTVENGKFTFTKTGEYTLTYKATDKSGNECTLQYEFTVLARGGVAGNSGVELLIIGGVVLVIGAGVCVLLIKKAKRNKKTGGK